MSRIVLATSGSYGDVHPYIAVGLGLRERGHSVCLAAPEYYRAKIEAEGLDFEPIRPDFVPMEADPETIGRAFDPFTGATFLLRKLVLPYVEETYRDLLAACHGAELLLIHPTLFPAPLVAEKLGIKWVSVVLSPLVFVSASDPSVLPPLPWMQALRPLGPAPHRLLLRLLKAYTRSWMVSIDEVRRREELSPSPRHPMHDDMFSPYGTLAWFSPQMAAQQPDWPQRTEITGFPVFDREGPGRGTPTERYGNAMSKGLEPKLAEFLRSGQPPVVFTLGSSAVVDARDFYAQSRDAVDRIGCRAVFVVGRDSPLTAAPPGEIPPNIFITPYAPFSELFPHAAAVVHQGGIGTTGQGLLAGVPMLVVPLGLDQPDNAARVKRLGVARVLPRKSYRAAAVARHLRALLNQPEYASAAKKISAEMSREQGVFAACSAIERVLRADDSVTTVAVGLDKHTVAGLGDAAGRAFSGLPARWKS